MKRKVIQIAGSTHLVSLPKDWINRKGVKKGDEVEIEEQGSKLMIITERSGAPKSIRITPEKFGRFVPHQLSAAYHLGYDDVEIVYSDSSTLEDVQKRLGNCIGYEIVNQGDNFCRIKTISHVSLDEFDQILRKTFLLLMSMGKNIIEVLERNEYQKLKETMVLEVTNNKLTDFCKRVLNVRGYKDHNKLTTVYTIATYLENMADEYRWICEHLAKKKGKLNPKVLADFRDVNDLFSKFYASFYKFSGDKSEAVFSRVEPLRKRVLDRMTRSKGEDILVLHSLINVLSIIYEMENANLEMNM